MKKGIFAMFILVASMAMVACTNANTTNEGAVGENDAFKVLEKRREYYKEQEKSEVEKVLKDIEAIPSLEKFIEDHSE